MKTKVVASLIALGAVLAFASIGGSVEQPSLDSKILYLHLKDDADPELWMNTLGDDPDDEGFIVYGALATAADAGPRFDGDEIDFPLFPEPLAVPLYFDPAGNVSVHMWVGYAYAVVVPSTLPMVNVTADVNVTAGSVLIGQGKDTATIQAPDPAGATGLDRAELVIEFLPLVASVKPTDGNLNLHVQLSFSRAEQDTGALDPGIGGLMTGGTTSDTPSRVELPLAVPPPPGALDLSAASSALGVEAGKDVSHSLTVLNGGPAADSVTLSVTGLPDKVTATFDPASPSVAPGVALPVSLKVAAASGASAGEYPIVVKAVGSSGASDELDLKLTVTPAGQPPVTSTPTATSVVSTSSGTPPVSSSDASSSSSSSTIMAQETDERSGVPGFELVALGLAAVGAVMLLRRRSG